MYEVFVYLDEIQRLNGNYIKIAYLDGKPTVGQFAGQRGETDYYVTAVYEDLGIIDVVCEPRN